MIVIVLGVLLLTTGVPSFLTFIENNRVVAQTNNYVSGLNIARSEAIKTGARVVLCKSDDGQSCDTGGAGYERGWVVFVDDGATDFDIDAGERILRVQEPLAAGTSLPGNGTIVDRVAYLGTGRVVAFGTVRLCLADHERRQLAISRQGRVRTQQVDIEGSVNCP